MARRSRWILTSGRDSLWHDHIQHECSKPLCWLNPAMGFRLQFLPADRSGLVGDWLVELTSERVLVVRVSHSTLYCDPLFQPGRGADMDDSPPLSLWLKPLLSALAAPVTAKLNIALAIINLVVFMITLLHRYSVGVVLCIDEKPHCQQLPRMLTFISSSIPVVAARRKRVRRPDVHGHED